MGSTGFDVDVDVDVDVDGGPMDVRPPVADFSPSMWGDFFSTFSFDNQIQETYAEAIETLRKEARSMLMAQTSGKLINLVDALERLGLAYHFETEIEEKLEQIYNDEGEDYDLCTTALRFRLLRQHGYQVTCSAFYKFTSKDGKLEETLISNDVEGLLSLYEAAHVRIHGEDILKEAATFTKHHLTRRMLSELESGDDILIKDKIRRALEQPLHRGVLIIQRRLHISIYERDVDSRDDVLLKLAKLNFNFLQNLYKKELSELSRWWDKFDLKSKLTFTRDRIIECYLLGVTISFEPEYSIVRKWVAKSLQMLTLIDDAYDNYATLEEAQLFTDILDRWDIERIDGRLPDYMKVVYQFTMSVYQDYERDAAKQDKSFALPCFIETVKQISRAYNQELKWVTERKMPSFDEYISNALSTSCLYVLLSAVVVGMKSVDKETIDWLLSYPKIVVSAAKLGRHLEDLGSHERENKKGQMMTVVDCYMKEHGVSKQETLRKFAELVEDGWKDVNTEWVILNEKGMNNEEMVEQIINYLRMGEFIYNNGEDGYTTPEKSFAPLVVDLFMDAIVL